MRKSTTDAEASIFAGL